MEKLVCGRTYEVRGRLYASAGPELWPGAPGPDTVAAEGAAALSALAAARDSDDDRVAVSGDDRVAVSGDERAADSPAACLAAACREVFRLWNACAADGGDPWWRCALTPTGGGGTTVTLAASAPAAPAAGREGGLVFFRANLDAAGYIDSGFCVVEFEPRASPAVRVAVDLVEDLGLGEDCGLLDRISARFSPLVAAGDGAAGDGAAAGGAAAGGAAGGGAARGEAEPRPDEISLEWASVILP